MVYFKDATESDLNIKPVLDEVCAPEKCSEHYLCREVKSVCGVSGCTRKTRIIDVVYNASNNELVRTKTLVKNCVILVDSAPFRQWYESHYALPLGRKKGAKLVRFSPFTKKPHTPLYSAWVNVLNICTLLKFSIRIVSFKYYTCH